ncbi:MAG: hypothetical protein QOE97_516 [Pseudonocardiales bacterium]|nr:hypothetical protein [Pseudonocardiales bacterium]
MQSTQRLQWWVLGSAALMVLGAFGPWVKALGQSVGGTDGSNDGWLVVAAAVIGGALFYATRAHRGGGVWAMLGGVAGVAVTLYDRSNVQNAIDKGGTFTQALVQIGWGLNLALAASASMTAAGAVYWFQTRETQQPLPPPTSSPPSTDAPVPSTPPAALAGAPTPPPD